MLASIRPSEMCGVDGSDMVYEQAQRVELRRASTVRISVARPVSTTITRSSMDQSNRSPITPSSPAIPIRHRPSLSLDQYPRAMEVAAPRDAAFAKTVTHHTLVEESSNNNEAANEHKKGRRGFTPPEEPTSPALDEYARQQKEFAASKGGRAAPPLSTNGSFNSNHSNDFERSQHLPSRRQQDRPTMSLYGDISPTRMTVGSMTSRPQSLAVQRPVRSKWTPSSSSSEYSPRRDSRDTVTDSYKNSEAGTINEVALDTDSDAAMSFVDEFKRSELAAYLASTPEEGHKSAPRTAAARLRANDNRTLWYSDTSAGSTPGLETAQTANVIFWSPKTTQTSISTRQLTPELEHWPLPAIRSSVYSPYTMQAQQARNLVQPIRTTHVSRPSEATVSSAGTVISPTFSIARTESTPNSTPRSSPIERDDTALLKADYTQTQAQTALKPRLAVDTESIAPSEISMHWKQSSKQRLGLGGRMKKKTEKLPWELEKSSKKRQPSISSRPSVNSPQKIMPSRLSGLLPWSTDPARIVDKGLRD